MLNNNLYCKYSEILDKPMILNKSPTSTEQSSNLLEMFHAKITLVMTPKLRYYQIPKLRRVFQDYYSRDYRISKFLLILDVPIETIIRFADIITTESAWIDILSFSERPWIDMISHYFDSNCWNYISTKSIGVMTTDDNDEATITYQHFLTEEMLIKYEPHLNWNHISMTGGLTKDVLRRFSNRLNFTNVSHLILDDEFITDFYDKLSIEHVCKNNPISENFLIKTMLPNHWSYAIHYNHYSQDFLQSNLEKVFSSIDEYEAVDLAYSLLSNQIDIDWMDMVNLIESISNVEIIRIGFDWYLVPHSSNIITFNNLKEINSSDVSNTLKTAHDNWINWYILYTSIFHQTCITKRYTNAMYSYNPDMSDIVELREYPITKRHFDGNMYNRLRLIKLEHEMRSSRYSLDGSLPLYYKGEYILLPRNDLNYTIIKTIYLNYGVKRINEVEYSVNIY